MNPTRGETNYQGYHDANIETCRCHDRGYARRIRYSKDLFEEKDSDWHTQLHRAGIVKGV
jgi:hypothetical protein